MTNLTQEGEKSSKWKRAGFQIELYEELNLWCVLMAFLKVYEIKLYSVGIGGVSQGEKFKI